MIAKKARPNTNGKPNTGSHTLATNNLDLSSYNSVNSSSICKQGPKDIFISLELINEISKKWKQLQDKGIEDIKVHIL